MLGALKLDGPLLVGLGLITLYGLVVLYSASGQNWNRVIDGAIRAALGGVAMCALAQVKPAFLRRLALPLWVLGVVLLIVVDITGHIGKGAQRWLDLGFIRFQPSEIMKLAVPMTCAWWLHERPLPPDLTSLLVLALIILRSDGLTILQPDLGTGGLILIGGTMVVILAGLQFRVIFGLAAAGAAAGVVRLALRALRLPEAARVHAARSGIRQARRRLSHHPVADRDRLGRRVRQGLLNGTQGQLEFLPERTTDFIFAMVGEELGLLGATILLLLYLFVVGRALYLAVKRRTRSRVCWPAASRSPSSFTCSSMPAWSAACCRLSVCRCRWSVTAAHRW